MDICEKKAPAEMLADEPGTAQGPLGPNKVPTQVQKIVAAPELNNADFAKLAAACETRGFLFLNRLPKPAGRTARAGQQIGRAHV